ncbi:MAG: peptidoglycan editing factor PgeF [Chloroflexi bacterium]|nr:peptidoglycan editing factor PgeF [Chloroflexota bacterium]
MPFVQADQVRYYTFDSLNELGVTNAIFTRRGGVSPAPWDSLNLGGLVGDDAERVRENRLRAFQAAGRRLETMYDVWQVHGTEVVCADAPRALTTPHLKADAMLTDRAEVTLLMRFADCTPILLYDPYRKVAGMAHAGWQGTMRRTAAAAVEAMVARYGCDAADLRAAIGPSIGAHHYEVGEEVVAQARQAFGGEAAGLLEAVEGRPGKAYFDLWAANRLVLEQCGIRHIEIAGICTACHPEDWYSHRREKGNTGRFGALIGLSAAAS